MLRTLFNLPPTSPYPQSYLDDSTSPKDNRLVTGTFDNRGNLATAARKSSTTKALLHQIQGVK